MTFPFLIYWIDITCIYSVKLSKCIENTVLNLLKTSWFKKSFIESESIFESYLKLVDQQLNFIHKM